MSSQVTLYSVNEVAEKIGIGHGQLRKYISNRRDLHLEMGGRLYMSEDHLVKVVNEFRAANPLRDMSKRPVRKGGYDTGTHVSARLALKMVCASSADGSRMGGAAAKIALEAGIGQKVGGYRNSPVHVAKSDLPLLARVIEGRGYPVKPQYANASQQPLITSTSRTTETAKLLGLTTDQAAELYLSLAADILERLK